MIPLYMQSGAHLFLTRENGLLHRATSLTFRGLRDAFVASLDRTIPVDEHPLSSQIAVLNEIKLRNQTFPLAEDGIAYYQTVHDFVSNYVNVYYSSDQNLRTDLHVEDFWVQLKVSLCSIISLLSLHSVFDSAACVSP